MENLNENKNLQGSNTQPEGNGKMFTQEEVNQIVSERLKRERTKTEPTEQEKRESEFALKESRLTCREYLFDKGYPAELLDILDTSDIDDFKRKIDVLTSLFPKLSVKTGMHQGGASSSFDEELANAFKRK